jgi:hypothetical protein
MKVLIETLNNRKGYKFFENSEEMDAYLGRHCKDISSYEVLQEDDTASTNDILQSLAEECEVLENKLFYIFRQQEKLKKAKQYQQLIYAAGRIYDACGAIRSCIK